MNVMRRFTFSYRLVLLFVVGLCSLAVAGEFVEGTIPSDAEPSLGSLVRGFVQGSSEQSTDERLSHILNHLFNAVRTDPLRQVPLAVFRRGSVRTALKR